MMLQSEGCMRLDACCFIAQVEITLPWETRHDGAVVQPAGAEAALH